MAVVNTNIAASIAQAALSKNERLLESAMEQLATGKKINSASDNAAGLAISTRMTSQIRARSSCKKRTRCCEHDQYWGRRTR